jgi:oxygen-dependent protoporphyrinogen oxidase
MKRIVIIGGGITGLAAAHRLIELSREHGLGIDVVLLEASERPGGVIHTEHRDGFLLERGPDSFISEKPEALALAKRLGLESQLIETNEEHRRSFIVRDGKLRPVPEGFRLLAPAALWPFVTSDIFSWSCKARVIMDLLLPRRRTNGSDDESLAQFVRRRFGSEALERMAQPMMGGIYTADPEKLSLRATMPRFLEMERKYGSVIRALRATGSNVRDGSQSEHGTSGARYSLFLTFAAGMQTLVDQIAAVLPQKTIQTNNQVESLIYDQSSGLWRIRVKGKDPISADGVCMALPAMLAARLLRDTDSKLAEELEAIPYASTATINLAYRRSDIPHPLNGFGFVVPFIEKRCLMACTFSSLKFRDRAPDGLVLLRAFVGGALQPEMFALDEAEMIQCVRTDLRDLLGINEPPLFTQVSKWTGSMPQYHVGHLDRLGRIDDHLLRLPALRLAGNAYRGVGIPDCISSGERAAGDLVSCLMLRGGDVMTSF